jgi:peptidoglycan/xylan/chitin deacetylase (PgdA/CDA1 family)
MAFTSMIMRRVASLLTLALLASSPAGASSTGCPAGTIYLSFDTGSMHSAELIAQTLRDENVRATFFLANEPTFRGDHSLDAAWAPYWKRLADEGHVFGNHTWSHYIARRDDGSHIQLASMGGRPVVLDEHQYCEELRKVEQAFARHTGRKLSGLWRAPGGRTTQNSVRYAAACGYPLHVHWDNAGFIGDELPSDKYPNSLLLERALNNLKSGDVAMMHLGIWSRKDPAAPILKSLIQGLKRRGFCFGTLGEVRR